VSLPYRATANNRGPLDCVAWFQFD
jgi:hypothetical protein